MKIRTLLAFLIISFCHHQAPLSAKLFWGSNETTTEVRDVSHFERIVLDGPAHVLLNQDETIQLEIEAEGDLINLVSTVVKGDTLYISMKESLISWQWGERNPITIAITLPHLNSLEVSGSGQISGGDLPWTGSKIDAIVSGSGRVQLTVDVEDLTATISGSGQIDVNGEADRQALKLSGSGSYNANELQSKTAFVKVSGSGRAFVNVDEELIVDLSGSGQVTYRGKASSKTIEVSGSGRVQRARY